MQLPVETLVRTVPLLIKLLKSNNRVVSSYAANTLDKIFTVKSATGTAA